jgi:hypothetical protein
MSSPLIGQAGLTRMVSFPLIVSASVLAFACGGGGTTPDPDGTTSGGAGSGGSSGGSVSAGGSTGGSDVQASGGSVTTGGSSSGGSGAAGGSGPQGSGGSVAQSLAGYTATGYNNACWAGSGNGDTIDVNGSGYLPMIASLCPKDEDMQVAQPYQDKIFNGCLDECAGDSDNWGHGLASVLSWNHTNAGWTTVQLFSNLHRTGMWPPAAGDQPTTLVFWIVGAVGGEQDKFTVAVISVDSMVGTPMHIPLTVTTSWQRVVIPYDSFNPPSNADALLFAPSGPGEVTFAIDQAYLSKTVPLP